MGSLKLHKTIYFLKRIGVHHNINISFQPYDERRSCNVVETEFSANYTVFVSLAHIMSLVHTGNVENIVWYSVVIRRFTCAYIGISGVSRGGFWLPGNAPPVMIFLIRRVTLLHQQLKYATFGGEKLGPTLDTPLGITRGHGVERYN